MAGGSDVGKPFCESTGVSLNIIGVFRGVCAARKLFIRSTFLISIENGFQVMNQLKNQLKFRILLEGNSLTEGTILVRCVNPGEDYG